MSSLATYSLLFLKIPYHKKSKSQVDISKKNGRVIVRKEKMEHKFVIGKTVLTAKQMKDFDGVYSKMSPEDREILIAKGMKSIQENPERYLPQFEKFLLEHSKTT